MAGLALSLVAPSGSGALFEVLDCDAVDHGPVREEYDFRQQRQVLATSGCLSGDHAVAFLHRYELEPAIQPLVDPDDPQGSGLTVIGDGWKLDLTGALAGDLDLALHLADIADADVARRLVPAFCLLNHPTPIER